MSDSRTLLWESSGNPYNTNITLAEPITHYNQIMIYGSGTDNATGGYHLSKQVYQTQPRKIGCEPWCYSPWALVYKCNYLLGCDTQLSGNTGTVGSAWYMGMIKEATGWGAGRWIDGSAPQMMVPWKIYGIDRKPVRKLTLLPTTGGTQSASETSGYEYDQITMSNTPDEGWYFSGYNVTGATVNGNIITLQDQDASAQAGFTYEGFPITYQNDGHGTLTGDTNIGIPGQPVNLTTAYNTYYRFSGYEVTGGYIQDGKLYATAACTAKAVYKPNAFTATGTFAYSNKTQTNNPTTGNYNATLKAFTGSKPSNWPATNANWKVSNASAYKLSWNTKVTMTAQNGTPTSTITGYTQLRIGGSNKNQVGANAGRLAKTITITNTGSNTTQGQPSLYCWNSAYYTSTTHGWTQCSPNGWTATGYAP